jgi:hypothetical protein
MKLLTLTSRLFAGVMVIGLSTAAHAVEANGQAATGASDMRSRLDATSVGIWKSYVPRGVKGELDSYDPIGLIAGALIKTDCSLNWRDPDDGKLYCFASGTSQVYFQDWPKTNIRKASEAYERLVYPKPGS